MPCVAIWYKPRQQQATAPRRMEVHFNLWRLSNKKSHKVDQFLDVGILVDDPGDIGGINLYVPFAVEERTLDLGKVFEQTGVAQTVFNEPWRTIANTGQGTVSVIDFDNRELFKVYELADDDMTMDSQYGGSIFRLTVPRTLQGRTYFRFRIAMAEPNPVTTEDKPGNSWLESAFFVTEVIDFHVNEKRNLPEDLLRTMRSEGEVMFTKVHLFLMRYDNYDLVFSHPVPVDSRTLEREIWTGYIGSDYACSRLLAHHWRQKDDQKMPNPHASASESGGDSVLGVASFNVFAKLRFQRANWKTILIFMGVLLTIGTIGSIIAGLILLPFGR